ncbi:cellulose-binding, family II [Flammeovirgaceae bacterium 311]|nr:cellulose-binding, family II [Flammeovirgaceae bacterium 311]
MKKLDYIDALRGVAILGVIMVHANQYGTSDLGMFERLVNEGARGIQLFYLASAFTLFLSFKYRLAKEEFPVRNFFIRRFFRIAPLYYMGVCYYLFQDGFGPRYWLGDATHISASNILANITFLHGFNPYWITSLVPGGWSIGVEMTFYTILPILFSRVKNISQAMNFFTLSLVLNSVLSVVLAKYPLISDGRLWTDYLFLYFPSHLPVFALGVLMYFIISENQDIRDISGKSLIAFCSIIFCHLMIGGGNVFFKNHIIFGVGFLIFGIGLSKYRSAILVNPVISHIGKISFGMYLVHFAVLHWLTYFNFIDYAENGILNYLIRFFIVTLLTAGISTVLYNTVEVKFQTLGKNIIDVLEKKSLRQKVELPKAA